MWGWSVKGLLCYWDIVAIRFLAEGFWLLGWVGTRLGALGGSGGVEWGLIDLSLGLLVVISVK